MTVCFCVFVTLSLRPLLPSPARPPSCSHMSSPCRGLTSANPRRELPLSSSLPLCWQSICLLHLACHSFPASPSSSSRKSSKSPCRWDEGEEALLRQGDEGQIPWFSSPGESAELTGDVEKGQAWHLSSRSSQSRKAPDFRSAKTGTEGPAFCQGVGVEFPGGGGGVVVLGGGIPNGQKIIGHIVRKSGQTWSLSQEKLIGVWVGLSAGD